MFIMMNEYYSLYILFKQLFSIERLKEIPNTI